MRFFIFAALLFFEAASAFCTVSSSAKCLYRLSFDEYIVFDSANPNHYAKGEIIDETLYMEFYLKDANGHSIPLRGKEQYTRIAKHFEGRFRQIAGYYVDGDNLDTINKLTASGMSLLESIKKTWSYQQASKLGYQTVTLRARRGKPGEYKMIDAVYSK